MKFIYESSAVLQTRFSKYKDKLVIIDFFSPYCGSCIQALPRLDSLQNRYQSKIQIIVVCSEPSEEIKKFFQFNKIAKGIKLPFIVGDSILKNAFPHYLIPHEVWLKDQKVTAITEGNEVNEKNIENFFLKGKSFHLPFKKDNLDFNHSNSLLSQLKDKDSTLLIQQSLMTKYNQGIQTRKGSTMNGNMRRQYFLNWPILSLYQIAWGFASNRIVLDVREPSVFLDRESDYERWRQNNSFCYEITLPVSVPDSILKNRMKLDLNSFISYTGKVETRKMNCWALQLKANSFNELGENSNLELSNKSKFSLVFTEDSLVFKNIRIDALSANFNSAELLPGKPIVINETGISKPINIKISKKAINNMGILKRELAAFGIDVVEVQRDLDVFVLKDK